MQELQVREDMQVAQAKAKIQEAEAEVRRIEEEWAYNAAGRPDDLESRYPLTWPFRFRRR